MVRNAKGRWRALGMGALLCAATLSSPGAAVAAVAATGTDSNFSLRPSEPGAATAAGARADAASEPVIHGGPSPTLRKAAVDTFYLYGGPPAERGLPGWTPQGKFETASGAADRGAWIGVDLTEVWPNWHISTFNAANLGATPAYWIGPYTPPTTNHAMWDGVPAGTSGFATAPGYGNNWDDRMELRATAANPQLATNLTIDLVFNFETEPNYDFFLVEWDSAGTVRTLAAFHGSNRDGGGSFTSPATYHGVVTIPPSAYVGVAHNQARLLLSFDSDGAWSDEDGLFASDGAVQVDNIQVQSDNGTPLWQATFEDGSLGGWRRYPGDFAGDFSKVFPLFSDIDPCRENRTPVMTFIDDGTPPNNDPEGRSTGGSLSPTWSYGVSGGWVLNHHGGLSQGTSPLVNEVWSPPIPWNLPGADDDSARGGAFLRMSVWEHLNAAECIYWVWHVRSYPDPITGGWSEWRDRNFVYGGSTPRWLTRQCEVGDLLVPAPDSVQVACGPQDLSGQIWFCSDDATPSPIFDNIAFAKYDAVGPGLVAREIDLFQDSFPNSGAIDCEGDRSQLAIRLDMARDIRPSATLNFVPGDSIYCDVVARKPGAVVDSTSIRLRFRLQANPCFATERAAGLAALQQPPVSDVRPIGPQLYEGWVTGRRSRTAAGAIVANRWYFDLPDGPTTLAAYQSPQPALFFPGDELRYFIEAGTLLPAETAILPADTAGFATGVASTPDARAYDRRFRVLGLPTLSCVGPNQPCNQPQLVVWNDSGHRGGEDELLQALLQNGLREREDFDTYTTRGPASAVSNGLGSSPAHGATAAQLAGYSTLLYEAGDLTSGLISDGSRTGNNDKGNDAAALTAWIAQSAHRYAAYFGDNIAFGLTGGGATYLNAVMGVQVLGTDLRASIGGQNSPLVQPTGQVPCFATSFVAYGGCSPDLHAFDHIAPLAPGAMTAHEFLPGPYSPAASVYWAHADTIEGQPYDRAQVTFPYGLAFVRDSNDGDDGGSSGRAARANLVRELLLCFGQGALLDDANAVAAPASPPRTFWVGRPHPNPFNPRTSIRFEAPTPGPVRVAVYDLRGELVRVLLDGPVSAGPHTRVWDGRDRSGSEVASGVYLVKVEGFGAAEVRKLALLR